LQQQMELADDVQRATEKLCARILRFPKPTVAAVNGHACAAGAMLMLSFDEVIMNAERGYCFVPGIDLGLTYSPGMAALMAARLPFALRHKFIVFGQRMTAVQLGEHAVVEPAASAAVLDAAIARAVALKPKARHGATMAAIKATLYHEAIAALEVEPDAVVLDPTFVPMGFNNVPVGTDKPRSPRLNMLRRSRSPAPVASDTATSLGLRSVDELKMEALATATRQSAKDLRKWAQGEREAVLSSATNASAAPG